MRLTFTNDETDITIGIVTGSGININDTQVEWDDIPPDQRGKYGRYWKVCKSN